MTLALIDGDILIYKAACGAEKETRWPDGVWTYQAREEDGVTILKDKLRSILEALKTKEYMIALTDDKENFRRAIYPTYKSNRKNNRKPLLLNFLKDYVRVNLNVVEYPSLEADDVMGIIATDDDVPGEKIIVTIDKDLLQIPVPVYNIDTDKINKPEHRNPERLFYRQVLLGDIIDGYPGCPGIGETTVEDILDNPFRWETYEHVFKSGKRKGLSEERWRKGPACSVWESIVSHYQKAGLKEEDALAQARCAYILQAHNYNEDGEITLWQP